MSNSGLQDFQLYPLTNYYLHFTNLTQTPFGCHIPGMQRLSPHPLTPIFKAIFCSGYFRGGGFFPVSSQAKAAINYILKQGKSVSEKKQVLHYSCNSKMKGSAPSPHSHIYIFLWKKAKQPNLPLFPPPLTTVDKNKSKENLSNNSRYRY